jgi:hypothetical protein
MTDARFRARFAQDQFHHSPEQISTLVASIGLAEASYRDLMTQARALNDAWVQCGTVNPDGSTVRHGANRDLDAVRNSLLDAASALGRTIARDFTDLVNYEVRYVGGRFVSDEVMEGQYAHCLEMIPDLRENLGLLETA